MLRFHDRRDAGRHLARRLQRFSGRKDVVVVGLPGGGVPVAFEVASAIRAPLEVFSDADIGFGAAKRPAARPRLKGQTLIVVDEGLANGSAMIAAVKALAGAMPKRIVVAAPVGAADVCARLRCLADECVLAYAPFPFRSLNEWYVNLGDSADDEIRSLVSH